MNVPEEEEGELPFGALLLSKPTLPTLAEINRLRQVHGFYGAKARLERDYQADLQAWLVESVSRLLARAAKEDGE